MVGAPSSLTFAEKMQRLLQHRAERQPLPEGYMRCPLNPEHQIPIAAIVTHLERAHQQDALALAPNAMYGSGTQKRRREFLERQFHRHNKADHRKPQSSRHHQKRGRHGRSRRSSYDSSSSSASSQNSLPQVNSHRSRRRYRSENQESYVRNNGPPVANYNGVEVISLPPHLSAPSATQCGSYHSSVAVVPSPAPPSRALMGRYSIGFSIDKRSLMEYLLQFGSVLRCDVQPRSATFTVLYDTLEAASRCSMQSYPSVIIDGVAVELCPIAGETDVIAVPDTGMAISGGSPVAPMYSRTCHVPPPALSTESTSQHPQSLSWVQDTPPVITVSGKPVGVAMLSNVDNYTKTNSIRGRNSKIEPPKCVFIAKLKKNEDGDKKEADERHIWEEFARFGDVSNMLLVGPRVVVEYASHDSVETITQALQKGQEVFACCTPL
ncbi:hypothetical protein MOQ_000137 [Trypanosoma cruzi marinkellei]|uniref:Uncharacterized protein n=1 Tax=Trypanosoma cruzi marinkellei TaxID=85056 RepID=K2NX60_TRYCR|nr:hypothetical protein MOQ_000137 [Trypanosoma cruzi marinkellei]